MNINYNEYDSNKFEPFLEILEYLGGQEPDNEEIWDIAREYQEMPIFENIFYSVVLSQIESLLLDQYGDNLKTNYYINARDTHLHINDEAIEELDDLKNALKAH